MRHVNYHSLHILTTNYRYSLYMYKYEDRSILNYTWRLSAFPEMEMLFLSNVEDDDQKLMLFLSTINITEIYKFAFSGRTYI